MHMQTKIIQKLILLIENRLTKNHEKMMLISSILTALKKKWSWIGQ